MACRARDRSRLGVRVPAIHMQIVEGRHPSFAARPDWLRPFETSHFLSFRFMGHPYHRYSVFASVIGVDFSFTCVIGSGL